MKRTLALKREALAELSTDELTAVNGAADVITTGGLVCQVRDIATYATLTNCYTCSQ